MPLTYVIADLHGRHDLLLKATKEIRTRAPGTIVTLGDYVDRGPHSRQIIEHLMTLVSEDNPWKIVALKGNHEAMMVETCRKPLKADWWLGNGGGQTLLSYDHRPTGSVDLSVVPADHLEWLDRLPTLHVDRHRVYVHAGVNQRLPLDKQDDEFVTWMLYRPIDEGGHGDRHVVHGHHQYPNGPLCLRRRTNLDTGAWYTGRLVVGVFDDDKPGGPIDFIEIIGKPDTS